MKNERHNMAENKGGRPPFYKTPKDLQDKIDEYFEEKCKTIPILDEMGRPLVTTKGIPVVEVNPPTVAGLALYLGFEDRRSIYDYANRNDEFSHTIKKAITRIEEYAEKQLTSGAAVGAMFWLKNHGWIDKTNQEITGNVGVQKVFITEEDTKETIKHIKDVINES